MYKSSIVAIMIFVFVGCGMKESTTQYRDKAYIKIYKDDTKVYTLSVDNSMYKVSDTKDTLYSINSGNKNIIVYDIDNNIVYKSKKYIGNDSTIEIDLR